MLSPLIRIRLHGLRRECLAMSEFKELVKSFAKSREYVRDFFVYGFKTRDDFKNKSARTYDNERRRIESWLAGYIRQDYTEQGKNISLAIDSNLLDTNPLYRVWKTKSFTDNDLLLHFFILDLLSHTEPCTVDALTDLLLEQYDTVFDVQTVRRKCNDYAREGLLAKEKHGKEVRYRIQPDFRGSLAKYPQLESAITFFHLTAPMGVLGSTLMDAFHLTNQSFRVKHGFCVHTLEDEVLLALLTAMREKSSVTLHLRTTRMSCIPLQVFVSTRSGRRFLCVYLRKSQHFRCVRMDSIKKVTEIGPAADYDERLRQLIRNHNDTWGVSFQNTEHIHKQWVKMTLYIQDNEQYILQRLRREGRGGTVTKTARNTYTYEKEVFDVNEMMPWIRTFLGRIMHFTSSSPQLNKRFQNDLRAMYKMYGLEADHDTV